MPKLCIYKHIHRKHTAAYVQWRSERILETGTIGENMASLANPQSGLSLSRLALLNMDRIFGSPSDKSESFALRYQYQDSTHSLDTYIMRTLSRFIAETVFTISHA